MSTDSNFDLDRYLRVSGATKPEAFDWSAPQPRLGEEALFCLSYMMDIESHTIVYMRDLLSTAIIRENEVTSFLSCWACEESFHSLLLRRLLAAQGVEFDDRRFADLRSSRSLLDKTIVPVARLVSRLTRHFPAVHMTLGAINEYSTLTGYQALIRQTAGDSAHGREPSLLTTVLERIIKDERRHFAFYYNQARRRLREPAAQRLTSFLLRRFWTPVGVMRRVCGFLFPDDGGLRDLGAVDTMTQRLPGLEWFNLARRYAHDNQRTLGAPLSPAFT